MSDSPKRRYVRIVRQPSLERKLGFLLLLGATAALVISLSSARDRLAKSDQAANSSRAHADTESLGR